VKEYKNLERNTIMEYRLMQSRSKLVPNPNFISFCAHYLFLSQQRIQESEAIALKHYLKKVGSLSEKRIKRLIIEQCSMSDESLNYVLQGILGQCLMNHQQGAEPIKIQYLQSFIYSNNEMGLKSLKNMKAIIPHIFEFSLNNNFIEAGYDEDGRLYTTFDIVDEIISTLASKGTKLMKLKLTKMNLKNENTIEEIIETLRCN